MTSDREKMMLALIKRSYREVNRWAHTYDFDYVDYGRMLALRDNLEDFLINGSDLVRDQNGDADTTGCN